MNNQLDLGKAFAPAVPKFMNFAVAILAVLAISLVIGWIAGMIAPLGIKRPVRKYVASILAALGILYCMSHITSIMGLG
ncbi:hypothetical protein GCM10025857_15020 [Alicyclobacillus contaminans]|uniref:hypothetical protein n=1 Tax=Alicyclobacillus contaminans TaxID=392016 RepID=UPI0003FA4FC8|nr:hypothetical protein [Alicyclobacillus contaminans]GMA50145.1 hypothetical protein GCM10025857_15020 [Alicyclobacillus contaminans]